MRTEAKDLAHIQRIKRHGVGRRNSSFARKKNAGQVSAELLSGREHRPHPLLLLTERKSVYLRRFSPRLLTSVRRWNPAESPPIALHFLTHFRPFASCIKSRPMYISAVLSPDAEVFDFLRRSSSLAGQSSNRNRLTFSPAGESTNRNHLTFSPVGESTNRNRLTFSPVGESTNRNRLTFSPAGESTNRNRLAFSPVGESTN